MGTGHEGRDKEDHASPAAARSPPPPPGAGRTGVRLGQAVLHSPASLPLPLTKASHSRNHCMLMQ